MVQCSAVKGDSPISLRWAFKSQPLATDSPITGLTINSLGDRISVLSIQSVAAVHNGEYTCTAENPAGISNYTATLTVNGTISLRSCHFCFLKNPYPLSSPSKTFRNAGLELLN